MENGEVYSSTTENVPSTSGPGRGSRRFPLIRLDPIRASLKLAELAFSLLAFICEEVVSLCTRCAGLYVFEFVSCSAFLLSLLVMIVYSTKLYEKVDKDKVKTLDIIITSITGVLFLIASIVFACTNDGTAPETVAIVFGFLASIIFIVDFALMMIEILRKSQSRKPEVPPTTLTQPLNAST
ncbi:CKLF-like MARVEL transmembrane domain-containing protein 6 [Antechinus flavipes]|uniref:CKLF-like MARVEL transmembrane domain-containing protein 6 n=1 Tax=Antechinus flavipes TaxID=38775 RepID=UPI002236391C|nr:CKLF-like MARVEL transmembrane domain-containing protein 6 [Antechinus flavipes]